MTDDTADVLRDDDDDEGDVCCMCGEPAVTEYEGLVSCGRWRCELQMQRGLDYISERGG